MTTRSCCALLAALVLMLGSNQIAQGQLFRLKSGGKADCTSCDDKGGACKSCNPCGDAGCNGCGKCRWRDLRRYEGQDPSANCGCNGSYKFPVPPLYTYHWPGLYAQSLMTDYQGPWRFPPIRPYTEDVKPAAGDSSVYGKSGVRQVSHRTVSRRHESRRPAFTPVNERLQRLYGTQR